MPGVRRRPRTPACEPSRRLSRNPLHQESSGHQLKLLFDENLSARLPRDLTDVYPGSAHIFALGLGGAADAAIWECAKIDGFVLVTKDEDFQQLSVLRGAPPKVIWIRLGNCATADVARLLRFRAEQLRAFEEYPEANFLALG